MGNYYRITGYAVKPNGNTVGVHFNVRAKSPQQATESAHAAATSEGYHYIRLNRVSLPEVDHVA